MRKFGLLGTSALRSIGVFSLSLAIAAPGYAQSTQPVQTGDQEGVTQAEPSENLGQNEVELESGQDADAQAGQSIVVTGSRIARPNLASTVPITSVGVQELTDTGNVSLGDELNNLPALRSTFNQSNSTRFIGTAGLNLLDLRGLGTERTLVLVNGRRHVTAQPGAYSVDTNTIPTDLLERVDVVTGGNSAIYGSDAVAGVVNFVLKRNFDGIRIRGQGGVSSRGDRGTAFTSLTAGKNFADDRGNVAVAFEYAKSQPLFATERDDLTGVFSGTKGFVQVEDTLGEPPEGDGIPDTGFRTGIRNNSFGLGGGVLTTCTGPIPTGTPANAVERRRAAVCTGATSPTGGLLSSTFFFLPDGTLARNNPTLDTRNVGGPVFGGLGSTLIESNQLQPGLDRYAANLLASFEVSSGFKPFLEAKFVRVDSLTSGQPSFTGGGNTTGTFSINNPFLTDQARTTLQTILAPGATTFGLNRLNLDFGGRGEKHQRDTYRVVAGFGGEIFGNFRYEVAGNYGRTETYFETTGNILSARFNNAANAVRNAAGQIVCAINADAVTTNDDPACVPINLFGFGRPSQEALNYIGVVSSRKQMAEQINATAFISGDSTGLFELPGGAVGFALGVEYRKEKARSAFDPVTTSGATFLNAILPFTPPSQEIKEVFGELRVPLLADLPFAEELTLEASGRASDYGGSTGTVFAYNIGGTFAPIRDIRFRAGYARSVRAPNLGNLFATPSQTFVNAFVDPCNQTVINQNPNRAKNCAAAGIPTTIVVNGETRPFTNTTASGISGFNQGNADLVPEKGTSLTVGAVIQPRFFPGFSLTIDYYDIKIRDVIQGLTGQTIINQCYDDPGGLDNQFCKVIFRRTSPDPFVNFTFAGQSSRTFTGVDTIPLPVIGPSFLNQPFNFANLKTSGVDVDAAYRRKIFGNVDLNLRGLLSYVRNRQGFTSITQPDFGTQFAGTLGDPSWEGSFSADLDFGMFEFGYDLRWIGKQFIGAFATQNREQGRPPTNADAFPVKTYPDVFYHDIRVGFEPNDRFEFYVGVDNVLDRYPPFGLDATGGGGAIFSNTGRFFYAGALVKF
jgi:outer membrane receptor protein involved in Fe transport